VTAVANEFRRHGRAADPAAVAAILSHAGTDVGTIAEKVAQVCASAPPGRIGAEQVEEVVLGHGSRGAFAVADAMCDRNPQEALVLLRGAIEAGHDPVMILGALAYRVRSIVAAAGRLEPKEIGLNLSPAQKSRLRGVRRNFGPGELTGAYRTLAEADVELKSGELPPELVIERAVVQIASRR
jgi:DNA polymerase III subunit delta